MSTAAETQQHAAWWQWHLIQCLNTMFSCSPQGAVNFAVKGQEHCFVNNLMHLVFLQKGTSNCVSIKVQTISCCMEKIFLLIPVQISASISNVEVSLVFKTDPMSYKHGKLEYVKVSNYWRTFFSVHSYTSSLDLQNAVVPSPVSSLQPYNTWCSDGLRSFLSPPALSYF